MKNTNNVKLSLGHSSRVVGSVQLGDKLSLDLNWPPHVYTEAL